MDPPSITQTLASVIKYLWKVSENMKQNAEECRRLCEHGDRILDLVCEESKTALSPKLLARLKTLSHSLLDISVTIEKLSKRSFLQRTLWRDDISSKIQQAYKDISNAMQEFQFATIIDLANMQHDNKEARRIDARGAKETFDRIILNDQDILTQLQVQSQQMQEAMLSLHKHLAKLPISSERNFLEAGLHVMQRRSGRVTAVPDEFLITSLDIIIHQERKLGAGGFAEVYEADWKGIRVAVKVLEKGVPPSAIQQEVNVWKRLRHPHILEFFGACPIADPPFMVCAFKENGDAQEFLRRHPESNRRQLLSQSAHGLDYLHRNNVVHGDLKATNILIDSQGRAYLADFGLSRVKSQTATIRKTQQTSQVGTVRWMAPEHMTYGMVTKKTDVYSFGMTMYEIFAGMPPFANTPDSILFTIICEKGIRPLRPSEAQIIETGLDDAVWSVMTQSWAQEPESRQTASELASALAHLCSLTDQAEPHEAENTYRDLSVASNTAAVVEDEGWNAFLDSLENFGIDKKVILQEEQFLIDFVKEAQSPAPSDTQPGDSQVSVTAATLPSSSFTVEPISLPLIRFPTEAEFAGTGAVTPLQALTNRTPVRRESKDDSTIQSTAETQRLGSWSKPDQAVEELKAREVYDRLNLDVSSGLIPRKQPLLSGVDNSDLSEVLWVQSGPRLLKSSRQPLPTYQEHWIASHKYGQLPPVPSSNSSASTNASWFDQGSSWFDQGRYVERHGDDASAVRFYQRGADEGEGKCLHRLGIGHLFGHLTLQASTERALPLLRRAASLANRGSPEAAYDWGCLLYGLLPNITVPESLLKPYIPQTSPDIKWDGRKYLEQAAHWEYGPALYLIGSFFEVGAPLYRIDPMKSIQYYRRATKQGIMEAYLAISRWFLCGGNDKFGRDHVKARKAASKAAEAGLPQAEFTMGYYDERGIGGSVNLHSARRWCILASQHGHKEAAEYLRRFQASPSFKTIACVPQEVSDTRPQSRGARRDSPVLRRRPRARETLFRRPKESGASLQQTCQ